MRRWTITVWLLALVVLGAALKPTKDTQLRPVIACFVGEYAFSDVDHRRKLIGVLYPLCDYLEIQLKRAPIVADLTPQAVIAFMEKQNELYEYAPITLKGKHHTIKLFAKYLQDERGVRGLARKIKVPKVRRVPKESLTRAELLELRDAVAVLSKKPYINTRNVAIFDLLRWTGLREHEVTQLRMAQINFRSKTIMGVQGKGLRYDDYPMHPRLVQALLEYAPHWIDYLSKKDWAFRQGDRTRRAQWPLVCSHYGSTEAMPDSYRVTEMLIYRVIKGGMRAIGFDAAGSGPHTLRRTFTTQLREAKVPLHVRAALMRHEDERTTQEYELVRMEEMRRELVKL